ncbi:MAG: AraC family transcriptional regulator [Prevotella sp.]|nr:AraC family transcriptional regulator [Prevotella sp.]
MKKLFLILAVLAGMTACTNGSGNGKSTEADSIYTWENIRKSMMEEPEHAFGLIDTAEMRGLADANQANWMRAQIYYESPKAEDLDKARDLCLKILDNKNPEADSLWKQKTLSLLVNICAYLPDTYQDAVRYAKQGAEMAHHAGDILQEANFYFEAGKVMERLQQGSGIDYMNRSMNILREASRDSIQPLPTLSSDLGNTARVLASQENYAAAIPLLQEKLQVISRIEKENPTAPAGWADQQRAYTYPVLAYCQQMNGDEEGARRSAEAFEQTQAAQQPVNQKDMLNYYALAGNAVRIQQIYDRLEPYYREKEDTISWRYADLLYMYAMGLNNIGRYREAYKVSARYQVINDSLVQRERQAETLQYAQQMKTQEKELLLKDEEAKTRMQRVMLIAAAIIILLVLWLLWRSYMYNKTLTAKNRELFAEVQHREQAEQQAEQQLQARPQEELTTAQKLYLRICQLMEKEKPFTNAELSREELAQQLGTNYKYVADAIRECSDGMTVTDFLNHHRLSHAAHLLATTDDAVTLIADLSGFNNRSYFNRLFRERYKLTPSEYRKVAKEKLV